MVFCLGYYSLFPLVAVKYLLIKWTTISSELDISWSRCADHAKRMWGKPCTQQGVQLARANEKFALHIKKGVGNISREVGGYLR
jgi:hypothetical protein